MITGVPFDSRKMIRTTDLSRRCVWLQTSSSLPGRIVLVDPDGALAVTMHAASSMNEASTGTAPADTKSSSPTHNSVDQDHLVPARMIRAADDREVEVGRMRGEIQLHH